MFLHPEDYACTCVQGGYGFLGKTTERGIGRSAVHKPDIFELENQVDQFWLPSGIIVEVCCVRGSFVYFSFWVSLDVYYPCVFVC